MHPQVFLSLGLCPSFLSLSLLTPLHVPSFQPTPHFQKTGVFHPRLYPASSGCPRASKPPPPVSGFLCCLLFSFPLREPQDLAQPSPDFLVPTHIEQWIEEASRSQQSEPQRSQQHPHIPQLQAGPPHVQGLEQQQKVDRLAAVPPGEPPRDPSQLQLLLITPSGTPNPETS